MLFNQLDKVPLRVLTQRRFAKMWVLREKAFGFDLQIGEIAAPASRHQDFLTNLVGFFQYKHTVTTLCGCKSAQESRSTSTKNNDIPGFFQDADLFNGMHRHK